MAASVFGFRVSPACTGTVTRPARSGCLNWTWEPRCATCVQPNRRSARSSSRLVSRGARLTGTFPAGRSGSSRRRLRRLVLGMAESPINGGAGDAEAADEVGDRLAAGPQLPDLPDLILGQPRRAAGMPAAGPGGRAG